MGYFQGELEFKAAIDNLTRLPKSREFVSSPYFGAAYVGGEGSSKSVSLCLAAILNAADDPNGLSLIGRLNMPALETTTMQIFLELVPAEWGEWAEAKKIWTFDNGHKVLFRHLDITDPKVQGHIKSLNLSKAYVDEASEVDEKVFLLLIGRLRRKTQSRRIIRLASNPAGHDYMWRHFFDPNRKEKWKQMYHGVNASSTENVFLPEEYLENRKNTYPADWADRFIYGRFTDFTDLVYKEFAEKSHVWDDTKHWEVFTGGRVPPLDWPVIVGMDIGSGSEGDPWALPVIAVAPNGFLYQFGEVYGVDLRIRRIADQLNELLEGRYMDGLAYDYAQRAAALELEEPPYNIYGTPAIKERKPGLMKVEQYMHVDPTLEHPFSGDFGSPRYFVAASCKNTIDELGAYKWPKDKSGRAKDDFSTNHEHSHMPDGIRYAIHTFRPEPEKIQPAKLWQNPALNEMSRLYWYEAEKHRREGEGAPIVQQFQRSRLTRFVRPSSMRRTYAPTVH